MLLTPLVPTPRNDRAGKIFRFDSHSDKTVRDADRTEGTKTCPERAGTVRYRCRTPVKTYDISIL